MRQIRQISNHADAIDHITSKAGNALRNDHVNFPCTAIRNHLVELFTVCQRRAADALVGIDPNQRPVRVPHDEILVILLLQLIGAGLLDIVRGYSSVDSNSLCHIIVVIVDLLLRWNELVVLGVHSPLDAGTDFLTSLVVLSAPALVNHGAYPLPEIHQEAASNHRWDKSTGL